MNRVVNQDSIDKLIHEMRELILFYEENLNYKKIRSYKIQKWIEIVSDPNQNISDKLKYYFQIKQYTRALRVFKENSSRIKKDTIDKMLSGGQDAKNDRSCDYFFEIDMASRLLGRKDFEEINLNDSTDIIFKSRCLNGEIFVECKNINSDNSFEKNIRKANNQLTKKLSENADSLKKLGVIAVDLSAVINIEEYYNLINPIMDKFIEYYNQLGKKEHDILMNRNFEQIFSAMLQGVLEFKFHKLFQKFENSNYKFHEFVVGIFYQAEIMVRMPSGKDFFIVRMGTYYPLCNNQDLVKFIFHPLAVGV